MIEPGTVMYLVPEPKRHAPTPVQLAWLRRGLDQPGGKLPLFDEFGQHIDRRTVRSCLEQGWAEPWYRNPLKPDWLVCRLTAIGRAVALHAGEKRARAKTEPTS